MRNVWKLSVSTKAEQKDCGKMEYKVSLLE